MFEQIFTKQSLTKNTKNKDKKNRLNCFFTTISKLGKPNKENRIETIEEILNNSISNVTRQLPIEYQKDLIAEKNRIQQQDQTILDKRKKENWHIGKRVNLRRMTIKSNISNSINGINELLNLKDNNNIIDSNSKNELNMSANKNLDSVLLKKYLSSLSPVKEKSDIKRLANNSKFRDMRSVHSKSLKFSSKSNLCTSNNGKTDTSPVRNINMISKQKSIKFDFYPEDKLETNIKEKNFLNLEEDEYVNNTNLYNNINNETNTNKLTSNSSINKKLNLLRGNNNLSYLNKNKNKNSINRNKSKEICSSNMMREENSKRSRRSDRKKSGFDSSNTNLAKIEEQKNSKLNIAEDKSYRAINNSINSKNKTCDFVINNKGNIKNIKKQKTSISVFSDNKKISKSKSKINHSNYSNIKTNFHTNINSFVNIEDTEDSKIEKLIEVDNKRHTSINSNSNILSNSINNKNSLIRTLNFDIINTANDESENNVMYFQDNSANVNNNINSSSNDNIKINVKQSKSSLKKSINNIVNTNDNNKQSSSKNKSLIVSNYLNTINYNSNSTNNKKNLRLKFTSSDSNKLVLPDVRLTKKSEYNISINDINHGMFSAHSISDNIGYSNEGFINNKETRLSNENKDKSTIMSTLDNELNNLYLNNKINNRNNAKNKVLNPLNIGRYKNNIKSSKINESIYNKMNTIDVAGEERTLGGINRTIKSDINMINVSSFLKPNSKAINNTSKYYIFILYIIIYYYYANIIILKETSKEQLGNTQQTKTKRLHNKQSSPTSLSLNFNNNNSNNINSNYNLFVTSNNKNSNYNKNIYNIYNANKENSIDINNNQNQVAYLNTNDANSNKFRNKIPKNRNVSKISNNSMKYNFISSNTNEEESTINFNSIDNSFHESQKINPNKNSFNIDANNTNNAGCQLASNNNVIPTLTFKTITLNELKNKHSNNSLNKFSNIPISKKIELVLNNNYKTITEETNRLNSNIESNSNFRRFKKEFISPEYIDLKEEVVNIQDRFKDKYNRNTFIYSNQGYINDRGINKSTNINRYTNIFNEVQNYRLGLYEKEEYSDEDYFDKDDLYFNGYNNDQDEISRIKEEVQRLKEIKYGKKTKESNSIYGYKRKSEGNKVVDNSIMNTNNDDNRNKSLNFNNKKSKNYDNLNSGNRLILKNNKKNKVNSINFANNNIYMVTETKEDGTKLRKPYSGCTYIKNLLNKFNEVKYKHASKETK